MREVWFWSFIIVLFFLFSGEPDLYDLLHDKAMNWAEQTPNCAP